LLSALVVGGMVGLPSMAVLWRRVDKNRPRGCYSSAQVIRAAGLLCPRIAPEARIGYFVSQYTETRNKRLMECNVWTVQGAEQPEEGAEKTSADVIMRWNADSGALMFVSRTSPPPRGCDGARFGAREAVGRCRAWLHELGVDGSGRHWRVSRWWTQGRAAWAVEFQSDRAEATVKINATDGSLQFARLWL
jgi:hypothetical protein